MKNKISILLYLLFVLSFTILALTSCGCNHVDKNDNGKCDRCGESYADSQDIPDAPIQKHKDIDKDHACDCGCDIYFEECVDNIKDGFCDYGCGKKFIVSYSKGLVFSSNGDGTCFLNNIGSCMDTNIAVPPTSPAGETVTRIGKQAFKDCTSLTSVTIPNTVTVIDDDAFHDCSRLASVIIPNSVTSIGDLAFYDCSSLKNVVIPDSVTSIGKHAFYSCNMLESVAIGNSVTSIGEWAFYDCISLKNIVIPDSITSIGDYAFYSCDSLESVIIGNSVTSIGSSAFFACSRLVSIYYNGNATEWNAINIGLSPWNYTSPTRYYYSKSAPTQGGYYWHYDANNKVAVWP